MTANAMIDEQGNRFGRVMMRWIAVWLLALLALGVTIETAGAQPSPGSYQNGFVAVCRNHGGKPKRVGSRVVRCTLGDGTTVTCDFNVDPPACTYGQALTVGYQVAVGAAMTGQVLTVDGGADTGPATSFDGSRATTATFRANTDDDQP